MVLIIDAFLSAFTLYLITGVIYSIFFYIRGARKIDPGTVGSPWHFKLIILPGVISLWPFLLTKSLRRK